MPNEIYPEKFNKKNVDAIYDLPEHKLYDLVYEHEQENLENGERDAYLDRRVYIAEVKKFLVKIVKNDYTLQQQYKFNQCLRTCGRQYVKGFGIQSLKCKLRGFLLKNINVDYDMVNAHPKLLLHLSLELGLNCPVLNDYCMNREKVLEVNGITKLDVIKTMNKDKLFNENNIWLKKLHVDISL